MFKRRNSRAAAHAANAPPASSAASTAAVQAFLASRASNSNLSSAAAAAALRSHTASPTNPGEIQTKRMQRRLSNASNTSASSRPTLQRRGSSSSMTDRTFRENSPLRSSSPNHPPIPPIPKSLVQKGMLRPSSAEPPRRIMSPPPKTPGGRGVSLDRGNVKPKKEVIPPVPKPRPARVDTIAADPLSSKRSSVNFSRPMSPVPTSSTSTPTNGKVTRPDSKIITSDEVNNIDYALRNQATTPVKGKKKKVVKEMVEGSHLAAGHSSSKPTGTAVNKDITAAKAEDSAKNDTSRSSSQQNSDSDLEIDKEAAAVTPQSSRPGERLKKRPSMVPEDADGEALAEKTTGSTNSTPASRKVSPKPTVSQRFVKPNGTANGKANVTPNGKSPNGASITPTSNQVLTPSSAGNANQRRASLSPSRNARFSTQLTYDTAGSIKHEPLPRAVSPAKSAMKSSPSRGPSPALLNADNSDNGSVAAEEGVKRKKKSVRVSFEQTPVVVGESAADHDTNRSPFIHSPQNQNAGSRIAFNLRRDLDGPEPDEVISPIPTLPSFGSVRGKKDKPAEEDHKVLYGDEQVRKNLADMTSSNDHAIGSVVLQDAASKAASADSVNQQVTIAGGNGESSDLDSSGDEKTQSEKSNKSSTPSSSKPSTEEGEDNTTDKQSNEMVPSIAVLPATPGQDPEKQPRDSWLSGMPGSFGPRETDTAVREEVTPSTDNGVPRRESIVEPEPELAQRAHSPELPTVGAIAESLRKQDDEADDSDTGESVYDDATEDQTDGDGFGSINAIVDSPVVSPIASSMLKTGKGKQRAEDESPSPAARNATAQDWEKTKTYWSGVNETQKAKAESDHVGLAVSEPSSVVAKASPVPQIATPALPPKSTARAVKKKSTEASTAKAVPAQQSQAPKKTAMKKTVRPTSETPRTTIDQIPPMRKTMRGPQPSPASSSRRAAGRTRGDSITSQDPAPARRAPPTSASGTPIKSVLKEASTPKVNGSANRMSTISTKSAPATTASRVPTSKPTGMTSNDSDSESSFKRERRRKPRREGAYSMKRSMRESRPQSQASVAPAFDGTSTLRNRPMSISGVSLRSSMRDKPPVPQRPSSVRVASPTGSFFGRRKKVEDKPAISRKFSITSMDDGPATFKSRFADSSDEEELTPVRGIPRRTIEEDSTDLDDSDDEAGPRPKPAATKVIPVLPAAVNSVMASKYMRPSSEPTSPVVTDLTIGTPAEKKKRSFFGVLGRRKDKSKIGKSDLDSPARRDTPLERTKMELTELARITTPEASTTMETPINSTPASPTSSLRPGKLQRRQTPQRMMSDSWPLPPPIPESPSTIVRPTTSDGTPSRPPIGTRRTTAATTVADGAVVGKNGKRKRFPMLRKAFGLHD